MDPDRLQYFLAHFWDDQKCEQIWILGPGIYHKNTLKIQEDMGASLNNIIFISENLKFRTCAKVRVPNFFKSESLKIRKCEL